MVSLTLCDIRKPLGHCFSGHTGYPVWHPTNDPIHPSPPYPLLPPWPSTMCIGYATQTYALRVTTALRVPGLVLRRAPRDWYPDRPGSGPNSRNPERWGASAFFGFWSLDRAYEHIRRWLVFCTGPPQVAPLHPRPSTTCLRAARADQMGVGIRKCLRRALPLFVLP